eukprot:TRINITY_DN141_c0_g1_i1.p1 TRINITY_DN141_c0_g1~~TRINITY_DN141_c0_g1_i1.p1  ORF type:complete len:386 (-),score=46.90 TRINITY_DN141_c0_g1_i1:83-1240(-)
MLRRPPRSTLSSSSAASDVYKRQVMIDAFYNSGPFIVMNPNTGAQQTNLQYNSQSIISQTNLLYIDVVAGVGFSTPLLNTYNDAQIITDAYQAIQQFLAITAFSSYSSRGINLMGTGYAGMIIPKVAQLLKTNNVQNFNGILIGNPTFKYDEASTFNQSFQNMFKFLASHNFVDEVSMSAFTVCSSGSAAQAAINPMCSWLLQKFQANFLKGVNLWDVYGTNCYDDNLLPQMYRCLPLAPLKSLLTSATVVTALHVSSPLLGWNSFFNSQVADQYDYYSQYNTTTLQALKSLIGSVKVWVYDSDSSALNSFVNTRFYLSQLDLGSITTAQTPYAFLQSTLLQDQLAGYITRYNGFVYATVKKGNYWAGQQQPLQYYQLLKNYLQG